MQYHNRTTKYIKYILSFFLVLGALFVAGQLRATAYAEEAVGYDRIYYFNMDSNGLEGSMILVQSGDHWGLMDAGHRYAQMIQDGDSTYSVAASSGLSSQIYCRNGRDVAQYMINQLGVTHLDFIIGTHAHSDHVGGIPEVAAATYTNAAGETCRLIDASTTYYYKQYEHISTLEDDLAGYSSNSWHNQAFANQAKLAMEEAGATIVNLAGGTLKDGTVVGDVITDPELADYTKYYEFTMNGMTFRMYNLDEQTFSGNENVNSIVTVISKNNKVVVNLADINTNNGAIDRVAAAIAQDYEGGADIVVAGHHGYAGSNTKTMFDELSPSIVVVSNGQSSSWLYSDGDLAAAIPYAENLFQTWFYNTSVSYYGTVTDLSGETVYVYCLESDGSTEKVANRMLKASNKTGWVAWKDTDTTSLWSYLRNGDSVKNDWIQDGGKWYYFDNTGIMQKGWVDLENGCFFFDDSGAAVSGWKEYDGEWYYLNATNRPQTGWVQTSGHWYYLDNQGRMVKDTWVDNNHYYVDADGVMLTGWQEIEGNWYYLNLSDGRVQTGWQKINNTWYYFNGEGKRQTGWVEEGGYRNYMDSEGVRLTGWQEIDGYWYYLDPTYGRMQTGWVQSSGNWYYLDNQGRMVKDTWVDNNHYYVDADGVMLTGWLELDGYWYYLDPKYGRPAPGLTLCSSSLLLLQTPVRQRPPQNDRILPF